MTCAINWHSRTRWHFSSKHPFERQRLMCVIAVQKLAGALRLATSKGLSAEDEKEFAKLKKSKALLAKQKETLEEELAMLRSFLDVPADQHDPPSEEAQKLAKELKGLSAEEKKAKLKSMSAKVKQKKTSLEKELQDVDADDEPTTELKPKPQLIGSFDRKPSIRQSQRKASVKRQDKVPQDKLVPPVHTAVADAANTVEEEESNLLQRALHLEAVNEILNQEISVLRGWRARATSHADDLNPEDTQAILDELHHAKSLLLEGGSSTVAHRLLSNKDAEIRALKVELTRQKYAGANASIPGNAGREEMRVLLEQISKLEDELEELRAQLPVGSEQMDEDTAPESPSDACDISLTSATPAAPALEKGRKEDKLAARTGRQEKLKPGQAAKPGRPRSTQGAARQAAPGDPASSDPSAPSPPSRIMPRSSNMPPSVNANPEASTRTLGNKSERDLDRERSVPSSLEPLKFERDRAVAENEDLRACNTLLGRKAELLEEELGVLRVLLASASTAATEGPELEGRQRTAEAAAEAEASLKTLRANLMEIESKMPMLAAANESELGASGGMKALLAKREDEFRTMQDECQKLRDVVQSELIYTDTLEEEVAALRSFLHQPDGYAAMPTAADLRSSNAQLLARRMSEMSSEGKREALMEVQRRRGVVDVGAAEEQQAAEIELLRMSISSQSEQIEALKTILVKKEQQEHLATTPAEELAQLINVAEDERNLAWKQNEILEEELAALRAFLGMATVDVHRSEGANKVAQEMANLPDAEKKAMLEAVEAKRRRLTVNLSKELAAASQKSSELRQRVQANREITALAAPSEKPANLPEARPLVDKVHRVADEHRVSVPEVPLGDHRHGSSELRHTVDASRRTRSPRSPHGTATYSNHLARFSTKRFAGGELERANRDGSGVISPSCRWLQRGIA